jgi:hypothetical protein
MTKAGIGPAVMLASLVSLRVDAQLSPGTMRTKPATSMRPPM